MSSRWGPRAATELLLPSGGSVDSYVGRGGGGGDLKDASAQALAA